MYVVVNNNVVRQYCYSSTRITTAIAVVIKCVFESRFFPPMRISTVHECVNARFSTFSCSQKTIVINLTLTKQFSHKLCPSSMYTRNKF